MADKTFSIYVKDETLYNRARELEKSGDLSVRDLCVKAIETAVKIHDNNFVRTGLEDELLAPGLADPETAQEFADDASNIEYTLQFQPNFAATQAMIDNVRDQGGWTIGFSKDPVGDGFWMLFGNPRVLTEP